MGNGIDTWLLMSCRGAEGSWWELNLWDCMPGQDAWSSAYTVHSILLQLQVFVLDPDLLFATHQVGKRLPGPMYGPFNHIIPVAVSYRCGTSGACKADASTCMRPPADRSLKPVQIGQ